LPYFTVDISDFDSDDIIEEVSRRNLEKEICKCEIDEGTADLIQKIYELRRTNQNYDSALDELIYLTIGKIL